MKTTAAAVIAALLSFLVGTVWVFASADMFVQYFYETRMVALAHVFTLGWVSLMIVGVLRQLGPVAFGLTLRGATAISAAVAAWIPALIAMIVGFATREYTVAGVATSVLFASIVTVTTVFLLSFRGVKREPAHNCLLAALLYFISAATLGAWMGLAKGFDVPLPAAFHRVLFAHIHLAGAGWAGMMIIAVMSRLFPQPHLRHPAAARLRFIGFQVGLAGLAIGLLSNTGWYELFGSILAVTCVWYALAFIPVLREFAQPSDRSTAFLVASWCSLGAVAMLGLWLVVAPQIQLQFVYGFLYLFGWLSFMMLGMLYRIIPTHVSKLLAARGVATPLGLRRDFVSPKLQLVVLIALLVGLVVASAGILAQNVGVFRLGWAMWMSGTAAFFGGLLRLGIAVKRTLTNVEAPS